MADYLYTMLIQASLLARNAPYIAHARTLAQRTRLIALMLKFFSAARWHSVDSRAKDLKIPCLVQQEPVIRRGGEEVEMMTQQDDKVEGRWSWVKRSWARRLLLLVLLSLGLSVLLVDYVRESNRHYQTEDVADREIRSPISFQ